jgi:hypothetical protein
MLGIFELSLQVLNSFNPARYGALILERLHLTFFSMYVLTLKVDMVSKRLLWAGMSS